MAVSRSARGRRKPEPMGIGLMLGGAAGLVLGGAAAGPLGSAVGGVLGAMLGQFIERYEISMREIREGM